MHSKLTLSPAAVFGFLPVLVRKGGAFVFLPLPAPITLARRGQYAR